MRTVSNRAEIWERDLFRRRLEQEQVAERNAEKASQRASLLERWPACPGLPRREVRDPLLLRLRRLREHASMRHAGARASPREHRWVDERFSHDAPTA